MFKLFDFTFESQPIKATINRNTRQIGQRVLYSEDASNHFQRLMHMKSSVKIDCQVKHEFRKKFIKATNAGAQYHKNTKIKTAAWKRDRNWTRDGNVI